MSVAADFVFGPHRTNPWFGENFSARGLISSLPMIFRCSKAFWRRPSGKKLEITYLPNPWAVIVNGDYKRGPNRGRIAGKNASSISARPFMAVVGTIYGFCATFGIGDKDITVRTFSSTSRIGFPDAAASPAAIPEI